MARYKPFGTGTFLLDDGSEYYLDDPERARTVLEELYGAQDPARSIMAESTNIAERGSVDRQGGELDKRQQLENAVAKLAGVPEPNQPFRGIDTGPDPMRRAVAGPGGSGGLDDDRARELGAELDSASGAPPDPATVAQPSAGAQPPPTEEELRSMQAGERYQRAAIDVARSARGGPAAGTRIDQSYSRKGGMPADEYARQSEARYGAFNATNEAIGRHYRENAAAADLQAQRIEAQALEQRQANEKAALELQRKEQKYLDDRAWLEKDVDEFYDKSKPDGSRWFKDGGVFRQLGTAIAQFMGAYASVISGSPNFANAIIDKKIERDIDDQIQAFRQGKMKRDGQLARMAERGMSVEQMKSGLRLQQEKVVQKELQAAALREGTREAKQAAEAMLLGRQEKFVAEENKFRTEALGEETVSGTIARGGGGALSPLEFDKRVAELLTVRNEIQRQAQGGAPAERAEDRAYQREKDAQERQTKEGQLDEPQRRAEAAHQAITELGTKAGLVRDKSGRWVVGSGALPPALLQKAGEFATGGMYQGDIGAAFDAAVEAFGRQQSGGVIGTEERPAFEVQLGKETSSRQQLADRLNAAESNITAKRKRDLDDIRAGRTNAPPATWSR
jgi:hypothetical protein